MNNFFGLNRDIRKHWIYKDAEYLQVWVEMLFCARYAKESHTDMIEGQLVTVNYSEFIFGRLSWSSKLSISENRLKALINKLIAAEMIEVVSKFPRFTVYKIKNYSKFNQQDNQQKTQTQQGISSIDNQLIDQHLTSTPPALNQHLTTKEEIKKERVLKHIVDSDECDSSFETFWKSYPKKDSKAPSLKKWKSYWKAKQIEIDEVMAGLQRYKSFVEHERNVRKFDRAWLSPLTFLNQRQWESEWAISNVTMFKPKSSNDDLPTAAELLAADEERMRRSREERDRMFEG